MKNVTHGFALLTTHAVWASLIICACLIGASASAFGQGEQVTTVDETYGKGGKKETITTANDEETRTLIYIRDQNVVREFRDTTIYKKTGKKRRETVTHYNCNGNPTYCKEIQYDILGNETRFEEKRYKDGKQVSGFGRGTRADGTKYSQRYNPQTGDYEDIAFDAGPASDEISTPQPDTSACFDDDDTPIEFFLGFSHNRVDGGDEREGFHGFNTSITSNISRYVGIKGDYSFHRRSLDFFDDGDDSKFYVDIHQILGGVQFQDNARGGSRVRPFAHLLAGVAHHRFSLDDAAASFSDSETGFGAVVGGGIDIRLNDRVDLRALQLDYNPNRINGQTQHNFRIGLGIVLKVGGRSDRGDDADGETDSQDRSDEAVPQDPDAKKCEWKRYNLGKDTNVTNVRSDRPRVVEVRAANLSESGGFEYHCLVSRGTALVTYKYTDADGNEKEGKLRVFCNEAKTE